MLRIRLSLLLPLLLAMLLVTLVLTVSQASITLAAPRLQAMSPMVADGQEYVVRRGDWLSKISQAFYGTSAQWQVIVDATNAKAAIDTLLHRHYQSQSNRDWATALDSRSLTASGTDTDPRPANPRSNCRADNLYAYRQCSRHAQCALCRTTQR